MPLWFGSGAALRKLRRLLMAFRRIVKIQNKFIRPLMENISYNRKKTHVNKHGLSIRAITRWFWASLVLITLYKHLKQQTECINQDKGLFKARMNCNRNTPICLNRKWTGCFVCCPERQKCSIRWQSICRHQADTRGLNLS